MRVLHQRHNPHRKSVSGSESQSYRRTDPAGACGGPVPVRGAFGNHSGRETRGPTGSQGMKPNRREFVRKGRDALIVGFSLHSGIAPVVAWAQTGVPTQVPTPPSAKPVVPEELDSWLSIGRDGKVTVYTGRIDMGTGAQTAFGQLISDELDVPFESVKVVMGDTELTPDQGKSTASSNASVGARPLRVAAAEARRTLLKMA